MQTLQQEIEAVLDKHFPDGLPFSRVEEAIKRGYCRIIDVEADDPVELLTSAVN